MMTICVFSDSHGLVAPMAAAIEREQPRLCFHLGDGERDAAALQQRFPHLPLYAVRGNCDLRSSLSPTLTCHMGGIAIFATHGHLFQVKYEPHLDTLAQAARDMGAGLALFGHTHRPLWQQENGLALLNPGAAAGGRYALLTIRDGAFTAELKSI
jgi:hypothetical protein